MTIEWGAVNKEEAEIIGEITRRACDAFATISFINLSMDIAAVYSVVKLDLHKFKEFDDADFYHDIFGIMNHIDRETGELKYCFLPRCSARGNNAKK